MVVLGCIVGAGLLAGAVIGALVLRWPSLEAPALHVGTIVGEVERHPRLAAALRQRRDPRALTGLALTLGVAVVVLGTAGVGILLAMVRAENGLASFDLRLAELASTHATALSTDVARAISLLGGTAGMVLLAVAVGAVEVRRTPGWAVPAFLACCALGQFAVANLVKLVVDRARPEIDQLTGFASTSFPSGHATAAAAGFAAAALLVGRRRSPKVKALVAGVAGGVAASVAATRVALGVHWFTDVLAGLLVGWVWFALCSIAFGGWVLRFGTPVERAERIAELEAGRTA